jgi:hypothetical protein
MSKEDDLLNSYFTEKDIHGLTHTEFQIAAISLISQGLMEVIEVNGKKMYRPTMMLKTIKTHLHSDTKSQS